MQLQKARIPNDGISLSTEQLYDIYRAILSGKTVDEVCSPDPNDTPLCHAAYARAVKELDEIKRSGAIPDFDHELPDDDDD